jgi:hypothetical protein
MRFWTIWILLSLFASADPKFANALSLNVAGSSFQGQLRKNPSPYYDIHVQAEVSGSVLPFKDSMSQTVLTDRVRLEGQVRGTCTTTDGTQYPLQGRFVGVVFSDGRAAGQVEYQAPPFRFTGREYGTYDWQASR